MGYTSFWSKRVNGSTGSGSTNNSGLDIISLCEYHESVKGNQIKSVTVKTFCSMKVYTLSWPSTCALNSAFPTAYDPSFNLKCTQLTITFNFMKDAV